ncbi:MAG: nucleotide sugar dehydrogenase [Actinobacteria bacterium]|nr:nucleotide sugar dehydrogenase [Actinomycetota bacterium]MBM3712091.1 nucleotide sugar dehydrogenase [Actinomycetota bacterium]
MEKICILGMGYIGMPTACMLANNGYEVLGVEVNDKIIDKLNSGELHINEPDLDKIFLKAYKNKKIRISTKVEKSDVYIIAVQTPLNIQKKADLNYVMNAANMIKDFIHKGNLIILESTCPPGTTRDIVGNIIERGTLFKAGIDYFLSFCPERVLPGNIVYELVNNDRIIGGINKESAERAAKIYKSFVKGKIYLTSLEVAEFVKLAENTFRDVNVAFSNELALICEEYKINVWEVIRFANMHPRVNILNPGPGVGGHCIPVDPWFILENIDIKDTLIEKCRNINDSMPLKIVMRTVYILKDYKNPKVTIFGLSYKENVDDTRESPAFIIINELTEKGINVSAYDPMVVNFEYLLSDMEEALRDSDLLLLFVGHHKFKEISLEKIAELMRNKNIFDTRNFYDKSCVEKLGFKYYLI